MAIRVLEKSVCEQIAAGEVVERPASVVKELVENAIDAGARAVEVELRRSGLELIRVTDDGCGIPPDEVRTAFLRHATSKISTAADLDEIATLGFRGEALAAICAVSRVKLVTKRPQDAFGTAYSIEGGEETGFEETGAPDGTSLYVRELFYNTPARMKFLKKDVHEGNAVEAAVQQQALAHPEVAFKLVREGKLAFSSPGTGELRAAVYSVFPREAADHIAEIIHDADAVAVRGFITSPGYARASRGYQFVFVNGRFVKSRGISASAEEACRGLVMAGKYPCFALDVTLPYGDVDINVHPAKTEVRFRNERAVTSAVYYAVKTALAGASTIGIAQEIHPTPTPEAPRERETFPPTSQIPMDSTALAPEMRDIKRTGRANESFLDFWPQAEENEKNTATAVLAQTAAVYEAGEKEGRGAAANDIFSRLGEAPGHTAAQQLPPENGGASDAPEIRIVGELFDTYIVAQYGDRALFVDKHAAHERILYEQIKSTDSESARQLLLDPVVVTLRAAQKTALLENAALLAGLGFSVDDFGGREVCVREAPTYFSPGAIAAAVERVADKLCSLSNDVTTDEREWLIHSTACRAAIKAGNKTSVYELTALCKEILQNDMPKFCPHGRPVFFTMEKKEFEKRFGRI